jgi:uncharacterized protein YndB with AHSA1/START domain
MKIIVERLIKADIAAVWKAWNDPKDIVRWNMASEDWHTTRATVDLRQGGKFSARMEAKDGSVGFDFEGVYSRVIPEKRLSYRMEDGREVSVEFEPARDGILVTETFDAESENPPEMQRAGWQAILDNFARHVEAKGRD